MGSQPMKMQIEVIIIPVSDVDRAKQFYGQLGWRLDLDVTESAEYRVVQFTPPGSACSIIFGRGVSSTIPGSSQGIHLMVPDLAAARSDLLERGIEVGEPFHDSTGLFHHADGRSLRRGLQPQRRTYGSYASFRDPDGNGWVFQEISARLLGDVDTGGTLTSMQGLQRAFRHLDEINAQNTTTPTGVT